MPRDSKLSERYEGDAKVSKVARFYIEIKNKYFNYSLQKQKVLYLLTTRLLYLFIMCNGSTNNLHSPMFLLFKLIHITLANDMNTNKKHFSFQTNLIKSYNNYSSIDSVILEEKIL